MVLHLTPLKEKKIFVEKLTPTELNKAILKKNTSYSINTRSVFSIINNLDLNHDLLP